MTPCQLLMVRQHLWPLSTGLRRPSAREWAAETTNDRRSLRRRVTLLRQGVARLRDRPAAMTLPAQIAQGRPERSRRECGRPSQYADPAPEPGDSPRRRRCSRRVAAAQRFDGRSTTTRRTSPGTSASSLERLSSRRESGPRPPGTSTTSGSTARDQASPRVGRNVEPRSDRNNNPRQFSSLRAAGEKQGTGPGASAKWPRTGQRTPARTHRGRNYRSAWQTCGG